MSSIEQETKLQSLEPINKTLETHPIESQSEEALVANQKAIEARVNNVLCPERQAAKEMMKLLLSQSFTISYRCKKKSRDYIVKTFEDLYKMPSNALQYLNFKIRQRLYTKAEILAALNPEWKGRTGEVDTKGEFQNVILIRALDEWYGEDIQEKAEKIADEECVELEDGKLVDKEKKLKTAAENLMTLLLSKEFTIKYLSRQKEREYIVKSFGSFQEIPAGALSSFVFKTQEHEYTKAEILATLNPEWRGNTNCISRKPKLFWEGILTKALDGWYGTQIKNDAVSINSKIQKSKINTPLDVIEILLSDQCVITYSKNQTVNLKTFEQLYNIHTNALRALKFTHAGKIFSTAEIFKILNPAWHGKTTKVRNDKDIWKIGLLELALIKKSLGDNIFNDALELLKTSPYELIEGKIVKKQADEGGENHKTSKQKSRRITYTKQSKLPMKFKKTHVKALIKNSMPKQKKDSIRPKSDALGELKQNVNYIKGYAFEQFVGVYLAYRYPELDVIPQYCLVVNENTGYYGMRADFKVGHTIYEIKWGANSATPIINECIRKQLSAIEEHSEDFKYKVLTCLNNTEQTVVPTVSIIDELKSELKDDQHAIETFQQLVTALQEMANAKNKALLTIYTNAFYSILEDIMIQLRNDVKAYILDMISSLALITMDDCLDDDYLEEYLTENKLNRPFNPNLASVLIDGELHYLCQPIGQHYQEHIEYINIPDSTSVEPVSVQDEALVSKEASNESSAEPKPESQPELRPETKLESKPELKPKPKPEPKPKKKARKKRFRGPYNPNFKNWGFRTAAFSPETLKDS